MVSVVLTWLSSIIIHIISSGGYLGVMMLMALESACLPVPSEIIMPFAGFLVWQGRFIFWQVIFWGALGNLIGSIVAYAVGYWGGRELIIKYGKYVLISADDLARADRWFQKYGQFAIFFSRLMPVVRTFISLPAGIARMNFKKFCFYTFLGSLFWSGFLAYAGLSLGQNWDILKVYFHKFDLVIGLSLVAAAIWWLGRHLLRNQKIYE
jgi:membrane protein DedA with SNARE-associated domain